MLILIFFPLYPLTASNLNFLTSYERMVTYTSLDIIVDKNLDIFNISFHI